MPKEFLPVTYKDFQRWIPETDIDGVDATLNVLADIKNMDYGHGFLKNTAAQSLYAYPDNVDAEIEDGYSLVSARIFQHSERGSCVFFVLYKSSITSYKFFIKDSVGSVELNIDEQNSSVVYGGAVSNVNYNLVNDQLKINLNFDTSYTALSKTVVTNLTLVYLPEVVYNATKKRSARWYLFPRWLGWSYQTGEVSLFSAYNNSYTEDFEDTSYIPNLNGISGDWSLSTKSPIEGSQSLYAENSGATSKNMSLIYITGITSLASLSFEMESNTAGVQIRCRIIDESTSDVLYDSTHTEEDSNIGGMTITFEPSITQSYSSIRVHLNITVPGTGSIVWVDPSGNAIIKIDTLTLTGASDISVVAKYSDGQRGLIKTGQTLGVYSYNYIKIKETDIDWRVSSYEIYIPIDDIYYLIGEFEVVTGWDSVTYAGYYTNYFTAYDFASTTTLNFNYGLGEEVRVDNDKEIYSEAIYHGRVYFVNGDYKIYQSHIAGSGLIQADSFPYDADTGFGFSELPYSEITSALAVTSLDELFILAKMRNYLYYIQYASGTVMRKMKVVEGGKGCWQDSNVMKELGGAPSASILAWSSLEGIFIYAGGMDSPINIIEETHQKYWQSLNAYNRQSAKVAYNYATNEIWVAIGSIIIIYEIAYQAFKKYDLGITVNGFIGSTSGTPKLMYLFDSLGSIYYMDNTNSTKLAGYIETHYSTGMINNAIISEREYKLMQELLVGFKDKQTGGSNISVVINIDGNDLNASSPIQFDTDYIASQSLTPIGAEFRKAKLKVTIPITTATIRELGYTMSLLERGLGQ